MIIQGVFNMLSKKTIRYKKLSTTQIESVIYRLEAFGEVSFHNTETHTSFFLLSDSTDSVIAFTLTPSITLIYQCFFINNKRFYES